MSRIYDEKAIKQELKRLRCSLSIGPQRSSFFLLAKRLGHLVDTLNVDTKSIEKFKKMTRQNRKTRLVMIPIYKSNLDTLVLQYINFFTD